MGSKIKFALDGTWEAFSGSTARGARAPRERTCWVSEGPAGISHATNSSFSPLLFHPPPHLQDKHPKTSIKSKTNDQEKPKNLLGRRNDCLHTQGTSDSKSSSAFV
ncbi:hypothetical protein PGTUg99_010863 [Puccinia graminis f. sp. tritici]|uniref:Uncharacterized protein n=1 Tax=Puccinia graminis f. sp. tritici TaxID=56615 RepID=A0A5B0S300_PUCGR|nr:hypothetical protein PGTUg99_010863 [Puccinia graminis f. sp. tritici]